MLDPRFKTGWIIYSGLDESDVKACIAAELEYRYRKLRENEPKASSDGSGDSVSPTQDPVASTADPDREGSNLPKRSRRQLFSTLIR